jgi:hypothetical protein
MTHLEHAGLNVIRRAFGERIADRVSFLYRDRVQPTLERLTYENTPRGRRSLVALHDLRNRYVGRRCFIIGNGPSLNSMDLSPLRNEFTFALNRGYLLTERMGAPASFLVTVNPYVVEQFAPEILNAQSFTFVSWRSKRWIPASADVTFLRRARLFTFAPDVTIGAWEGATVTYVALQLAFYMGFSDVILIGVDHSFATEGPANELVTSSGSDPNHFDESYFGVGVKWQLPDLKVSEIAYKLARDAYAADGRLIRDATVNGKLTIFPKVNYEEVVQPPV